MLEIEELIGHTEARLFTPPLADHADPDSEHGIKPECTWGYDCIDFLENVLGWKLLPWHRWLYARALEKQRDGTGFRFQVLVVLVSRQNGKTFWLRGLGLWRLFMSESGEATPSCPAAKLALIAAQSLSYAENTLKEVVDDIREHPLLKRELVNHRVVNGAHKAILTGNRTWRAVTATRKGGRSLSADLAIIDELRELTNFDGWNAITPATIARPYSQIVCASNAGDDRSEVLRSLRDGALRRITVGETDDSRVGLFEWSLPAEADPKDPQYWPMANPSLGLLNQFTVETLKGRLEAMERSNMAGFLTEHMALDVETPLLTVGGWKTVGTIEPGDQVFRPDGHAVDVVGATSVYEGRPCYRVETSDGRSIVVDEQHRWAVRDSRRRSGRGGEFEVLTTKEIIDRGVRGSRSYAFRLPDQRRVISKPVDDLPIDPYLLGMWLGDGCSTKPQITSSDDDVEDTVKILEESGVKVSSVRRTANARGSYWTIQFNIGAKMRDGFNSRCQKLGIWGNKHVPDLYLTSGTEQRQSLLAGLLDSDGTIDKVGRVTFVNTNERLAQAVLYLARSLGYRAHLRQYDSELNGRVYGPKYVVSFTPSDSPFRLPRKSARVSASSNSNRSRTAVWIKSITPVASRPVRCITVDNEDGLFLAGGDLVPTHNCMWVNALEAGIIPAEHWAETVDEESRRAEGSPVYAAVDVNYDRSRAYVAIAARREDGNLHTEVVAMAAGTDWLIPWLKERKKKFAGVAVQEIGAPASAMIADFEEAGIPVVKWGPAREVQAGCAILYDGIVEHTIYHRPAPVLDRAATSGAARHSGDAWIFDRRNSPVDVAPLVALTGAVWLEAGRFDVKNPQVYGWDEEKVLQWEREAQSRWGMGN